MPYYCPGACNQLVGRGHTGPGYMVRIFIREQGPSRKQQAQKRFDRGTSCGIIPYNLKKGIMMNLKVKVKDVYGQRLVYPVCDMSKSFAYLVGCKTLPKWATDEIKRMGYTLTVETPELEPDA